MFVKNSWPYGSDGGVKAAFIMGKSSKCAAQPQHFAMLHP